MPMGCTPIRCTPVKMYTLRYMQRGVKGLFLSSCCGSTDSVSAAKPLFLAVVSQSSWALKFAAFLVGE
jgi:hypothetical protein